MKRQTEYTSRRRFLRKAAAGAAMMTAAPGVVLRLRGADSSNNKLNIAAIGVGGQGGSDLNELASENIVALCDVDHERAAASFKKFPNAAQYQDYRVMFDKMDRQIDAVLVATPDHFHSVAALEAMRRGKHVFCEKPMAHSIYEVREMMKAAHTHKVITQLGNQGHSFDSIRVFREWIEDGAIGAVREVHVMCNSNYSHIDQIARARAGEPVPESLNWDIWLGPAAYKPYSSEYVPGKWRGWTAFGTGVIGDWTCHLVDPVFWTLDLGAPTTIEADTGDYDPEKQGDTFPAASMVRYEFPAKGPRPAVNLFWHDGANVPARPEEFGPQDRLPTIGGLVIGEKGKIVYGSHGAGQLRLLSKEAMAAANKQPQRYAKSPGHHKEWIECCKSGKPAGSHFDYGGPLTEIALLGVIAIRCKGEKLHWDAAKMKFTNSPRANGLLKPTFRKGWKLE
jgi:predicted dehydrogenase